MATNVDGMGSVVAQHYNKLQEKGKEQRKDSRIYFMRNFNNWIKSTLIQEYIEKIRDRHEDPGYKINVLDIGKFLLSLLHSPRATKYIYTYYLFRLREGRRPAEMAEKQRESRGGGGHRRDQHRAVQGALQGHEPQGPGPPVQRRVLRGGLHQDQDPGSLLRQGHPV